LYCKLPQDSPLSVRGARNYPCMGHPGKRAPTVEICNSDQPYMPLSMRQHVLGPSPIDPNLIAQGVPLDDRVNPNARIFGPIEGTPLPPGAVPRGTPPGPRGETAPPGTPGAAVPPVPSSRSMWMPTSQMAAELPEIAPLDVPLPGELPLPPARPAPPAQPAPAPPPEIAPPDAGAGAGGQTAPSSFDGGAGRFVPSVAIAHYDPHTGRYVGSDGKLYQQSDLATVKAPKTWRDMLPTT
jgi:phospholipid/cholesterol/gamma-HCH transport system substrate-binding protein